MTVNHWKMATSLFSLSWWTVEHNLKRKTNQCSEIVFPKTLSVTKCIRQFFDKTFSSVLCTGSTLSSIDYHQLIVSAIVTFHCMVPARLDSAFLCFHYLDSGSWSCLFSPCSARVTMQWCRYNHIVKTQHWSYRIYRVFEVLSVIKKTSPQHNPLCACIALLLFPPLLLSRWRLCHWSYMQRRYDD